MTPSKGRIHRLAYKIHLSKTQHGAQSGGRGTDIGGDGGGGGEGSSGGGEGSSEGGGGVEGGVDVGGIKAVAREAAAWEAAARAWRRRGILREAAAAARVGEMIIPRSKR